MWIAITVVVLTILLNSFLIGKLYKRFNLYLSSGFCLTLGCISFFGLFGVILMPLLLFAISFEVIFYIMIVGQAILLILYIVNWRWFFISYRINWRLLIIFSAIAIAFALGYIATRQFEVENHWFITTNSDYYLQFTMKPISEISVFSISGDNFSQSFINFFFAFFIYIFNISTLSDVQFFSTFITLFIFIYLGSLICNAILISPISEFKVAKIMIVVLTAFFISTISFVFTDALWIIILLLFLVHIHGLKQNQLPSSIAIYVINLAIPCGIVFNINFLIVGIIINLIALLTSFRMKRVNATDFNILMLFTTLLYLSLTLNNRVYLNYIFIAILIVIYSFYMFYKSSSLATRINKTIDNFMYAYVNWFSIIIGIVITIASIAIFFTTEDYAINISWWILDYIGNPSYLLDKQSTAYQLANVIFWSINIAALLFAILNNGWFLKKVGFHTQSIFSSAHLDIPILVVLIFWNPINSNIYLTIIESQFLNFTLDFKLVFFTLAIPVLYILAKEVVNYAKMSYIDYTYVGVIATIGAIFITALNI